MRAADGHEMVFLNVAEIDESGRAQSITSFDEDALADAIDELTARYLAGEGASRAADLETGRQFTARINAGDWDGIRSLVTEDFEVVDTRRLSWPTLGRDEFIEAQESYDDQIAAAHVPAMRAPLRKCSPVDQREHRRRRGGRGSSNGCSTPSRRSPPTTASSAWNCSTRTTSPPRSPASTSSVPNRMTPVSHGPRTRRRVARCGSSS